MSTVVNRSRGARAAALTRAGVLAAAVLGLDQLTKHTIATGIAPGETDHIIGSVLEFVNVRNTGVAFGFLSGSGAVVLVVTLIALAALLTFLIARPERRGLWIPTGMLVGGAIGNLIDRIGRGSVIDFIKLPHWDAFNVADMSITFGVIALLLVLELGNRRGRGR
jgi:signal peptidase II